MMVDSTGERGPPSPRHDQESPPGPDQFYGPPETSESSDQATTSVRSRRDPRIGDDRHYRESDTGPVLPIDTVAGGEPTARRRGTSSGAAASTSGATSRHGRSSTGSTDRYRWVSTHLVVIAVNSRSAKTATTLGRVALNHLKDDTGKTLSSDRVRAVLLRDFEAVPKGLESEWLPMDALPASSEKGTRLLNRVRRTSEEGADTTEMPGLFTEFGEPIVDGEGLKTVLAAQADDERVWLIPAVLFQ